MYFSNSLIIIAKMAHQFTFATCFDCGTELYRRGELYDDKCDDTNTVIIGKVCNLCCNLEFKLRKAEALRTLMIQYQEHMMKIEKEKRDYQYYQNYQDYQKHMMIIEKISQEKAKRDHQEHTMRIERLKRDNKENMMEIKKLRAERDEQMNTREELREQKNNLKQVAFDCQAARPFIEGTLETRKFWEVLLDNLMCARPNDMNGVIQDIFLGMRGDFSTPSFTVRTHF